MSAKKLRTLYTQYNRAKAKQREVERQAKRLKIVAEELKQKLLDRFGDEKEVEEGDCHLKIQTVNNPGYTVAPFSYDKIVEI